MLGLMDRMPLAACGSSDEYESTAVVLVLREGVTALLRPAFESAEPNVARRGGGTGRCCCCWGLGVVVALPPSSGAERTVKEEAEDSKRVASGRAP